MPTRSLRSPVLRWPDRQHVDAALRTWAGECVCRDPTVRRIGYFGSYARGDWGVGSDLDVVIVVADEPPPPPFEQRGARWDLSSLPVPADLLVYTESEWRATTGRHDRFARMLDQEVIWILGPGARTPGEMRFAP
jgi:uncharacterized protein